MFQIKVAPSEIRSASFSRLFASMVRSSTFSASIFRSYVYNYFWTWLSRMPVFGCRSSPSLRGWSSNSALVYSLHILPLRLEVRQRATALTQPYASEGK